MPRPLSPANRISQRWQTWLIMPLLACAGVASCEAFSSTASDAGAPADAAYSDIQVSDSKPIGLDGALDGGPNPNLVGTEGICVPLDPLNDCPAEILEKIPSKVAQGLAPIALASNGQLLAIAYGFDRAPYATGAVAIIDGKISWPTDEFAVIYRDNVASLVGYLNGFSLHWNTGFSSGLALLSTNYRGDAATLPESGIGASTAMLGPDIFNRTYIREQTLTTGNRLIVRDDFNNAALTTIDSIGAEKAITRLGEDPTVGRRTQGTGDNVYIAYKTSVERRLVTTNGENGRRKIYSAPNGFEVGDIQLRNNALYFTVAKPGNSCEDSGLIVRIDLSEIGLSADGGEAGIQSNAQIVAEKVRCPAQIAVDGRFVYWTESVTSNGFDYGGTLRRVAIDQIGKPIPSSEIIQKAREKPRRLIATATGLYWLEYFPLTSREVVVRIRADQR